MKAAVTLAPGEIEVREVAEPELGPDDALISMRSVGLCGSDIHFFGGHHPYARYPQIQGHELAGVVERLPDGYRGRCRLGDLVVAEPLRSCGDCFPCRRGRTNCCVRLQVLGVHAPGALAERLAVPASSLYPAGTLPEDLAALVEPCSIGLEAITRSGAASDDRVLVLGGGPIGLMASAAALDRGAEVMVVDRLPNRLELARALGADRTVDTSRERLIEALEAWTEGEGPAVVIEATGVPQLIRQAAGVVAPSGVVVVVGLSDQEVDLPVIDLTRKELNLLGSRNSVGLFADAVDLVSRWRERLARLVTHRFPFLETPQAMRFATENQAIATKVLVRNGAGRP